MISVNPWDNFPKNVVGICCLVFTSRHSGTFWAGLEVMAKGWNKIPTDASTWEI